MRKIIFSLTLLFFLSCRSSGEYTTRTYLVMGTLLNVTLPEENVELADSVYKIFAQIDTLMNPINPSSDVYRINHAKGRMVKVSPLTLDCIKKAIEIAEFTGGAFDPTVGRLVHIWHFDEQGKYIFPPEDSIKKYLETVDYRKIEIKGDSVKIGENQAITLAGIAKGYAIDLAVQFLRGKGVKSAIVDAGGDLYVIGGKDGKPWKVGIRDPKTKGVWKVLMVKDRAICTSGDYERFVEHEGKKYSHIFDPRTGYPVSNGVMSVTVISNSATVSDALATAFFVLGPEKSIELAGKRPDTDTYIITTRGVFSTEGMENYLAE